MKNNIFVVSYPPIRPLVSNLTLALLRIVWIISLALFEGVRPPVCLASCGSGAAHRPPRSPVKEINSLKHPLLHVCCCDFLGFLLLVMEHVKNLVFVRAHSHIHTHSQPTSHVHIYDCKHLFQKILKDKKKAYKSSPMD